MANLRANRRIFSHNMFFKINFQIMNVRYFTFPKDFSQLWQISKGIFPSGNVIPRVFSQVTTLQMCNTPLFLSPVVKYIYIIYL